MFEPKIIATKKAIATQMTQEEIQDLKESAYITFRNTFDKTANSVLESATQARKTAEKIRKLKEIIPYIDDTQFVMDFISFQITCKKLTGENTLELDFEISDELYGRIKTMLYIVHVVNGKTIIGW